MIRAVLLAVSLCAAMAASAQQAPATAKVVSVESLTHNVKRLRVRMPKDYRFEAGQFALLTVPPAFVEAWNTKYKTKHGGAVRRPYSLADRKSVV